MEIDQQYRRKVWDFLRNMSPGSSVEISSVCSPENREQFIECVKMYMDCTPWQGWLSFNASYTLFYKTHPIDFEEIKNLNAKVTKTTN